MNNLGLIWSDLADYQKAIEFHEACFLMSFETDSLNDGCDGLINLGSVYLSLEQPKMAMGFLDKARNLNSVVCDRRRESVILGNLGLAYFKLQDVSKAISCYDAALIIRRECGYRRGEAMDLANLGSAYYTLRNAQKCIKCFEMALLIFADIGDRRGEAGCLGGLGSIYDYLKEYHKAIGFYERQLKIVRECSDICGEGNALYNSSLVYAEMNDNRAVAQAEAALKVFESINDPFSSDVRHLINELKRAPRGFSTRLKAFLRAALGIESRKTRL